MKETRDLRVGDLVKASIEREDGFTEVIRGVVVWKDRMGLIELISIQAADLKYKIDMDDYATYSEWHRDDPWGEWEYKEDHQFTTIKWERLTTKEK